MAVDPIDGTSLTANGINGAISVIALSPRGSIYDRKLPYYSFRHGVLLKISVMSIII
jgi:fructose-1,6-bisphosphatase/sedoheptulose 1,7-bisphosphatase-like protein